MTDDIDDFTAALQDLVLPASVPVLPGIDLAARFSVPAAPGEATGAWFDVVVLRQGRVALTMGQVPGSGLAVVASAAAVSAVLRAGLLDQEDVEAALRLADAYARASTDVRGTSAVVVVLDPTGGRLCYGTAGHSAPLMAVSAGPTHRLPRTGTGPLGSAARIVSAELAMTPGALLVLDSTTEADGTATAMADVLDRSRVEGDVSATCEKFTRLAEVDVVRGPLAVVLAEARAADVADLDLEVPLGEGATLRARRALEAWLGSLGVVAMDRLSLSHATTELVANAVEHAYAHHDEPTAAVRVTGRQDDTGEVVVEVIDHGQWRIPSDDVTRGRGLAMASGLVDDLTVSSDADGTRARLRHRVSRSVPVDRVPLTSDLPFAEPLAVTHTALGSLRLSGVVGHDDLDEITYALLLASRGRTQPVDLDLTEVSDISTGGLRVLDELVRTSADESAARAPVVLHVRRGSTPQAALERAGIDHRAS
ncbi:ATP-binding SpoIIE family protein phosphatase [Nocardioides plantarum]|uniref:ATP-binding protein n=1 Tax=Nocardioides plantarum TaxID=29299 RepID=A0ABV5KDR4_9ACTN|nr:ATP-binding protein [Nocardioides plantarum]